MPKGIMHAVVHDLTVAGDPGLLCKGKQSCRKLHRVQDLRKEATAGVVGYVQMLLGIVYEACGSRPHCLVLTLIGATLSPLPSRQPLWRICVIVCSWITLL